ncbi:hypothetical protein [Streptomyces sp. NBC_01304]|nr:hypothetical protein OG430_47820 [Streptomyces sp. NBC_01304]
MAAAEFLDSYAAQLDSHRAALALARRAVADIEQRLGKVHGQLAA